MKPQILNDIDNLKKDVSDFKVGSFVRNTTLVSSDQSITGLGFKPKCIIFLAVVPAGVGRMSIGFTAGGIIKGIYDLSNRVTGAYSITNSAIHIRQGDSAASYTCSIKSLDSDGFTLAWVKGAAAIDGEEITVQYLALK